MSELETPIENIKRIKLVISDLHLGKGKILPDGGLNSLEEFYYDDKLVEFLHYYSTGQWKDYEIELIINGDFLNFLQVDYRGHFLNVLTEPVSVEILRSIIDGHPKVFLALREFLSRPKNLITYVVGNHDQPMLWPTTRAIFNDAVGGSVKFKNIVYYFEGVHVEHGHMHEPANRLDPKRFFLKKDLPEPILNLPFGSLFFIDFVMKIKEKHTFIDKVRPFHKMIRWLFFNETRFAFKATMSLMLYFLKGIVGNDPRKSWPLTTLVKVVLENAVFGSLDEAAKKILDDPRVNTVIFGHTHVYNYKQWHLDKEYFNTGTWTEVTSLDVESLGRITKLTYVLLEYPAEGGKPRGRLKEWRGYHRIEEDVAVA